MNRGGTSLQKSWKALRGLSATLSEFFTLNRRFASLGALHPKPGDAAFGQGRLGLALLRNAQQLDHWHPDRDSASVMYSNAIALMAAASRTVIERQTAAGLSSDMVTSWEQLVRSASPRLQTLLCSDVNVASLADIAHADAAPSGPVADLRSSASTLARIVFRQQQPYRRLIWQRTLRIGVASVVALVALVWAAYALLTPTNLALKRPVAVSSSHPVWRVDPSRVVDGKELALGFHTAHETNATVTVDLGKVRRIRAVELVNRPDCCHERSSPLAIQVSLDGVGYTSVAERKRAFYRWKAGLRPPVRARYVRVLHLATGYFHLAELKVF